MLKVEKVEWDLSPLLKGDDDPSIEKERAEIEEKARSFIDKWKNKKDYLESPKILKEAFDEYEFLMRVYGTSGKEGYYFSLRMYQDQANPAVKAKAQKIEDFSRKLINDLQFFRLNLSKIPEGKQKEFLDYPELKEYKHFLERLFENAKHILSDNEEKIINLTMTSSYNKWIDMLSSFYSKDEIEIEINGRKEKKRFEEIQALTEDNNPEIRKIGGNAFNKLLDKHLDVAENEINAILAHKKVIDELRRFERADKVRHVDDDIESEVVDLIVESVSRNFDISRRFFALKAKLLGLKKMEYYERNATYGRLNKKYPYEVAVQIVKKVFSQLDPEFLGIFNEYLKNGNIDVYPKKGKSSGAWCTCNLITQPTYILLNYTDVLDDVKTLAHELGHGINNEFMKKKCNSLSFETPKSTAEVASMFMEDFVLEELAKEADDELKLAIHVFKLNYEISTIFRQIAFYRFETEMHREFRKKGYLSKEELAEIFKKHMADYMGDAVNVENAGNWWSYVPHFRQYFYVYSYASGLLISKAMQSSVRKDRRFIERIKEFLSAGTSDSPKNIFLKLGIDIRRKEFWESGLKEIDNLLKETEELARKLGKI